MNFSERAHSCTEGSSISFFFATWLEKTATFFYLVPQMVEGEEIVKIFCYFPDIFFPFVFTDFVL
jgi:hypothetical protein